MMMRPTETIKATLSADTTASSAGKQLMILADPENEGYETAWEQMLSSMEHKTDNEEDLLAWQLEMGLIDMPVPKNDNEKNKFQVLVFKDHMLTFPELFMQVAVLGPPEDAKGFPALFSRARCEAASCLEDADIAVFTGGPDVCPAYYGEDPVPSFFGNDDRDYGDIKAYLQCVEQGIPMIGVCRGAQFLAAMNQYKLVQDLNNHTTDHRMWDVRGHFYLDKISSLHHQSVIPGPGMDVLATATESTYKTLNPGTTLEKSKTGANKWAPDIEAYFIRKTCCLGVQGHPEYKNYNAYAKWFLELINEFVSLNEDVDWENGRRRVKQEFRDEIALITNTSAAKTKKPRVKDTLTINASEKEG